MWRGLETSIYPSISHLTILRSPVISFDPFLSWKNLVLPEEEANILYTALKLAVYEDCSLLFTGVMMTHQGISFFDHYAAVIVRTCVGRIN